MPNNLGFKDFLWLLAILICSGLFSLAISFSIGYIKMSQRVPRKIFIMSILIQILLSSGIFIGVMLWYFSDLASDAYFDKSNIFTGAFLAYVLSAVPEIFFSLFVLLGKYASLKLKDAMGIEDNSEMIMPKINLKSVSDEFYSANADKKDINNKNNESSNQNETTI